MPRLACIAAILLPVLIGAAALAPCAFAADPPAALVATLDGPASMTDASGQSRTVHAFDWLNPETTLETGAGARLTLAFSNGRRYDMREHARLTVVAAGATNLSGPVRPLPPLPPMPKLPAVAPGSGASSQSGAVRVRSMTPTTACRYPRDGYTVQADQAVLRVQAHADSYRIEILDDSGTIVFEREIPHAQPPPIVDGTEHPVDLSIPAGTLRAATHYSWRVRDASGKVLDHADFTTLSADSIAQRTAFIAGFPRPDADTLALFAEVDQRLGLLLEARDELRQAAARTPHSQSIDSLLRDIELDAGGN